MNWYRITVTAAGIRPAVCELQAHNAPDAVMCAVTELALMDAEGLRVQFIECIDPPVRRRVDQVAARMEPPK